MLEMNVRLKVGLNSICIKQQLAMLNLLKVREREREEVVGS